MNTETQNTTEEYIGTRKVINGGRFTMPADTCERLGIGYDDDVVLTIEVLPDDQDEVGAVFETKTVSVLARRQVTIPKPDRDQYDIGVGDHIAVLVRRV